jgi:hypothetical protein
MPQVSDKMLSALSIRTGLPATDQGFTPVNHLRIESETADLVPAQKEALRPILDVQRNQWPETLAAASMGRLPVYLQRNS